MPNENLRGGYGLREEYVSENLMLGAFLAGFGKTSARASTVAGLVWPRYNFVAFNKSVAIRLNNGDIYVYTAEHYLRQLPVL